MLKKRAQEENGEGEPSTSASPPSEESKPTECVSTSEGKIINKKNRTCIIIIIIIYYNWN